MHKTLPKITNNTDKPMYFDLVSRGEFLRQITINPGESIGQPPRGYVLIVANKKRERK